VEIVFAFGIFSKEKDNGEQGTKEQERNQETTQEGQEGQEKEVGES
jgi:hypothetical protein